LRKEGGKVNVGGHMIEGEKGRKEGRKESDKGRKMIEGEKGRKEGRKTRKD
jgi:hypothetical protein